MPDIGMNVPKSLCDARSIRGNTSGRKSILVAFFEARVTGCPTWGICTV